MCRWDSREPASRRSLDKSFPIAMQVGPDLLCDVPQEVRCRLWMALLQDPSLAEAFRVSLD